MRLPRDLSGIDLAKALRKVGYQIARQSGSHIRVTCLTGEQHHVTIPAHDPLKIGTLAAILSDVASHLKLGRDDLIKRLLTDLSCPGQHGSPNSWERLGKPVRLVSFKLIAAPASRAWSASSVLRSASLNVVWPRIDMNSFAVAPAFATRRSGPVGGHLDGLPVVRNPQPLRWGGDHVATKKGSRTSARGSEEVSADF